MEKQIVSMFYLRVADLNFKFVFHNTSNDLYLNGIERGIQSFYKGFISSKMPKNVHLSYLFDSNVPIFFRNTKAGYVELYSKHNNNIYIHQHTSIVQFIHIFIFELNLLLLKHNGCILHASGNKISKNKAILFMGKPGAGKSTTMKAANHIYPAIADDSIILRKLGRKLYVFQTPIIEKNKWIVRTSRKFILDTLYFIQKKQTEKREMITSLSKRLSLLLEQVWTDKSIIHETHKLISELSGTTPVYYLSCRKNKKKVIQFLQHAQFEPRQ